MGTKYRENWLKNWKNWDLKFVWKSAKIDFIAFLLCREMLDMGANWIFKKLRVENSLSGALKVYFWILFASKSDKILKKSAKIAVFW